ncbi:MAG: histone deacetylase [Pseudomonadota bacterium]
MSFVVFSDPIFRKHKPEPPHPESPARLEKLEQVLQEDPPAGVEMKFCGRAATADELLLVHTDRLMEQVAATSLQPYTMLDADTYATADSAFIARTAAGTLLHAVDLAAGKPDLRVFTLVRPPGHHAERDRAMGFCLFNNIALAAEYAVRKHGVKRVAIYDFDLHHGNGTQEIFYERPDVLYVSHHQAPFYPGTGDWKETGRGDGVGATVNCPLPKEAGDSELLGLWDSILQPAFEQFKPELFLVSAGYDSHAADPLGNLRITDEGFTQLSLRIEHLARKLSAPVVYTIEGGYNPDVVASGVLSTISSHTTPETAIQSPTPTPVGMELITQARKTFGSFFQL